MAAVFSFLRQSFPGKPKFTENDVPDLTGKVTIVTGSNTGLGKEIAEILYSKNAIVYMMARSEEKTQKAIESIQATVPQSDGKLVFIRLDLADLTQVKAAAEAFLRREQKLHVLFNNAGIAFPERNSKTRQGIETQLGVNCVGTFALTKILTPTIVSTAKTSPPCSVRVIWASSTAAEFASPKGFVEGLAHIEKKSSIDQYAISKLGNYFHATEFAARHYGDGVVSIPLNPGNLDSELWRTQGPLMYFFLRLLLNPPRLGAYTNLFAAFSPQLDLQKSGAFVSPWGQLYSIQKQLVDASRSKETGGSGTAKEFWNWTEAQAKPYL